MITRTKLGQKTPKIQWWNPIKLVNFGPTPTCHPSPHPDKSKNHPAKTKSDK